jgi:predicted Zn-dependent peptidase
MQFLKKLSNGITVTGEHMDSTPAVSMGFWVRTGGADELPAESGLSHFLEHMTFKGTPTRTPRDIAAQMDGVGGTLNAFTTKEETCFYVKVAEQHADLALDLLVDILFRSEMSRECMALEKTVVLDEIAQAEDDPEDRVHELMYGCYFGDHPLAQPVLGEKAVIRSLTREGLLSFRRTHYAYGNIVFSIAGSFDEDKVCSDLEKSIPPDGSAPDAAPRRPFERGAAKSFRYESKTVEQLHIALGFPGVARDHRLMYPLNILNNVLGGGMSSRLFQTIREEMGLVYGIFSYPVFHADGGMLVVDTGTADGNGVRVLQQIREEMEKILSGGVGEEEFVRAREQLKGNFILSREGIESRMSAGGRSVLFYGERRTQEDILARIDAVTPEQMMEAARMAFDFGRAAAAFVGRRSGRKAIENLIETW